jgi:hypothetical protein
VQALFEKVEMLGPNGVWLYPSIGAEARGWAAATSGEFRVEERKTGRGERIRGSATRRIRGCRVTVGGRQGHDLSLTA